MTNSSEKQVRDVKKSLKMTEAVCVGFEYLRENNLTNCMALMAYLRFATLKGTRDVIVSRNFIMEGSGIRSVNTLKDQLRKLELHGIVKITKSSPTSRFTIVFNENVETWNDKFKDLNKDVQCSITRSETDQVARSETDPALDQKLIQPDTQLDQKLIKTGSETDLALHTYSKKEEERSKKKEIYKEEFEICDPEIVDEEHEVQRLLQDWREYISDNQEAFKVNANRVWGDGIAHAKAITDLMIDSGVNLVDIRIVFDYWSSGQSWFKSCLTPRKLLHEKDGETLYSKLRNSAETALEKNASYQFMLGLSSLVEAQKNGTLEQAPF